MYPKPKPSKLDEMVAQQVRAEIRDAVSEAVSNAMAEIKKQIEAEVDSRVLSIHINQAVMKEVEAKVKEITEPQPDWGSDRDDIF